MPHYCKAAQHGCVAIICFASGCCFTRIGKLVSLQAAVRGLGGEGPLCLPMQGPAGPGMPQTRGSSHRLSFAGLCKTSGPDLRTVYLLCLSPGISESQPAVGDYVSLGNLCGNTTFCLQSRHTQAAGSREREPCESRPSWEGRLSSLGCLRLGAFPLPRAGAAPAFCAEQGSLPGSGSVPPS